MKTIFFGASAYVLPLIDYLQKNFELALVITTESQPTDAVPRFCTQSNIPFLSVTKLNEETIKKIKALNVSFAILADFRLLIKQEVIDLFPKGIINIHPSLLPEYRGPTPGTTALLDGKTITGVSLMLLDKDLDHGPLLGAVEEKIEPTDTSVTLYQRLFARGVDLLGTYLELYLAGKLQPQEQDHSKATYTHYMSRQDGYIDLKKIQEMSPVELEKWNVEIERAVRAYFPWPGVWTKLVLNGKERVVKILPKPTSVIPAQAGIHAAGHPELVSGSSIQDNDQFLIQVEGKKPQTVKDFLNGYPDAKELVEKLGLK